ncbi:MAG: carboxypeptidase-like regulatory domain-containing protein [Saprospiraceae bacterium]
MSTRLLTLAFFLLNTTLLFAQLEVSGRIVDTDGDPLPGVNVYDPVSFEGATTDSVGVFVYTAFPSTSSGDTSTSAGQVTPFTIKTQYIGFKEESFVVTEENATGITFKLKETATALSEVVVSAGAFVASDTRKVAVLSSVDVATTGATADLAEAMNTLPGSTPAGESGQLLVRGGSAAETQAYINGMRVPNLYTSALPDVPSRTRFSPFAFKGITFASGGFSAQYGDALSAALILQTQDLPEKTATQVSLMTLGGDVTHTQRIGENQAFAIGVGGTHMGGYAQLNDEVKNLLIKAPQGINTQAAYWWTGKDGRNFKAFAQAGTNGYSAASEAQAKFYGGTELSISNQNLYAQAVYQQPQGITGLWEVGTSVGGNRDEFTLDQGGKVIDQVDLQARASYSDNFKEVALWRAGVEQQARHEQVDVSNGEAMINVGDQTRHYTAAFAEADWYLNRRWVVRTGLRADAYADGAGAFASPRGQLSYLFSASHQIAVSAGRYVQRQSDDELFSVDHNLQAATLNYYGLTYSRSWEGRVLRAEAYAKTYDALKTNLNGVLATDGDGYSQGFDLFFRDRKSVKNSDFWISYSYNAAERLRDGLTERAPVTFAAKHNVALVAKRFFPKPSFGINATYQFHSGRGFDNPNSTERFAGVTPDFHNVSLNVTYLTNIKGHFTVIFASLSNVTGARQVHQYRYAQQPEVNGNYDRLEVDSLFPRFPFVGMFVSIGDKNRVGDVDDI